MVNLFLLLILLVHKNPLKLSTTDKMYLCVFPNDILIKYIPHLSLEVLLIIGLFTFFTGTF